MSQFKVVVTPIVAFLADTGLLDSLIAADGEVAHIFTHPLEALLDPSIARQEPLVAPGTEDWIYDDTLHVRSLLC